MSFRAITPNKIYRAKSVRYSRFLLRIKNVFDHYGTSRNSMKYRIWFLFLRNLLKLFYHFTYIIQINSVLQKSYIRGTERNTTPIRPNLIPGKTQLNPRFTFGFFWVFLHFFEFKHT